MDNFCSGVQYHDLRSHTAHTKRFSVACEQIGKYAFGMHPNDNTIQKYKKKNIEDELTKFDYGKFSLQNKCVWYAMRPDNFIMAGCSAASESKTIEEKKIMINFVRRNCSTENFGNHMRVTSFKSSSFFVDDDKFAKP